jgi:hypothetical protein
MSYEIIPSGNPVKYCSLYKPPPHKKPGFGYLTESGLYLGDNGGSVRVRPGVLLFTGVPAQSRR